MNESQLRRKEASIIVSWIGRAAAEDPWRLGLVFGAGTLAGQKAARWAGCAANAPKRIVEPGNGMVDNLGQ